MNSPRDRHLFGPGPKRILSLDGGGLRGVVSVAFLEALESLLRRRHGRPGLVLQDYFDLIGGTSTGSIIATLLALGMPMAEVKSRYFELGPKVFRRSFWRLPGVQAKYASRALVDSITDFVADRALDSEDLETGLAIVMKRLDSGSPWIVANNPRSAYWDDPADGSYIGNRHFQLRQLVRASTAAPTFFAPEWIEIVAGQPPGVFVDGGVSPFNNPTLLLLMMATQKSYGLQWATGERQLSLTSVGTGRIRPVLEGKAVRNMTALGHAVHALRGLINDNQQLTLTLMQWLSEPGSPWMLNSEVGDLSGEVFGGTPAFHFQRYDIDLSAAWLERTLGVQLREEEVVALRRMDNPATIARLHELARAAADSMVVDDLVPASFDLA